MAQLFPMRLIQPVPKFLPGINLPRANAKYIYDPAYGCFQSNGGASCVSGDPVGYWLDKSGNANHVEQLTSSAKPTWRQTVSALANKTGVEFATDDYLWRTTSGAILANETVFAIYVVFFSSGSNAYFMNSEGLSSTTANTHMGPRVNSAVDDSIGYLVRDGVGGVTQPNSADVNSTDGNKHLLTFLRNGSNWDAELDGVSGITSSTAIASMSPDRFAIGALLRSTVVNFLTGTIGLVAGYNADNRTVIEPIIRDYFGIAI